MIQFVHCPKLNDCCSKPWSRTRFKNQKQIKSLRAATGAPQRRPDYGWHGLQKKRRWTNCPSTYACRGGNDKSHLSKQKRRSARHGSPSTCACLLGTEVPRPASQLKQPPAAIIISLLGAKACITTEATTCCLRHTLLGQHGGARACIPTETPQGGAKACCLDHSGGAKACIPTEATTCCHHHFSPRCQGLHHN